MIITTRDFGQLELDEKELVTFRSPIYGYEHLKKYAFLSDDSEGSGLMWLQSVEEPDTCFIILDPEVVGLAYAPELPEETVDLLQLQEQEPVICLVVVIPDDFKEATVNCKSPIVINPVKKYAAQVILEADYPIRMPLFAAEGGK